MMVGVARGKSAIATATWTLVTREEAGAAGAKTVPRGQERLMTAAVLVDDRGLILDRCLPLFEMAAGMMNGKKGGGALSEGLQTRTTEENDDA